MARIRTIKPEFFRHEGLQDLEVENAGKYPMMVFAGLWGHCDKTGRFEWRPRQLKLDILPFLPFDMEETLGLLLSGGFVEKYSVDGKWFGYIKTFGEHQRISGKEAQESGKYPEQQSEATGKQQGSNGDQQESQEGKGRGREEEREGKGNGDGQIPAPAHPAPSTKSGEACKAIREAGVPDGNPSHPTLLALIEAGATEDEFRQTAIECVARGKASFAYVIGTVRRRREEAAKLKLHKSRMPPNKQEALEASNNAVGEEWERKMREQMAAAEGGAANAG